jgi:hypothetical protein
LSSPSKKTNKVSAALVHSGRKLCVLSLTVQATLLARAAEVIE